MLPREIFFNYFENFCCDFLTVCNFLFDFLMLFWYLFCDFFKSYKISFRVIFPSDFTKGMIEVLLLHTIGKSLKYFYLLNLFDLILSKF